MRTKQDDVKMLAEAYDRVCEATKNIKGNIIISEGGIADGIENFKKARKFKKHTKAQDFQKNVWYINDSFLQFHKIKEDKKSAESMYIEPDFNSPESNYGKRPVWQVSYNPDNFKNLTIFKTGTEDAYITIGSGLDALNYTVDDLSGGTIPPIPENIYQTFLQKYGPRKVQDELNFGHTRHPKVATIVKK
jgi:hypothetical protein